MFFLFFAWLKAPFPCSEKEDVTDRDRERKREREREKETERARDRERRQETRGIVKLAPVNLRQDSMASNFRALALLRGQACVS